MIRSTKSRILVAGAVLLAAASFAGARPDQKPAEPETVVVSIYHCAPGMQLDFLKWMAARDAAAKEAGVAPGVMYAHTDGDSWDYISIGPDTTDEQDKKVDAVLKAKGLKTGFQGGLELRKYISSHTDTFARGPMSAADLVKAAQGN